MANPARSVVSGHKRRGKEIIVGLELRATSVFAEGHDDYSHLAIVPLAFWEGHDFSRAVMEQNFGRL